MVADDPVEVWRDVRGYEGWYQVSTMCRVRSVTRTHQRKPNNTQNRRRCGGSFTINGRVLRVLKSGQVHLYKDGCRCQVNVNTLAKQHFSESEIIKGSSLYHMQEG